MTLEPFYIKHPSPLKWEAVSPRHGKLGDISCRRKRDLIGLIEEQYNGDLVGDDLVLIPLTRINVKQMELL